MRKTFKIGYVGYIRDYNMITYDNRDYEITCISEEKDICGRDFDIIIRGWGWEHIDYKHSINTRICMEIERGKMKLEEMEYAYKHPFKYWWNKMYKKYLGL